MNSPIPHRRVQHQFPYAVDVGIGLAAAVSIDISSSQAWTARAMRCPRMRGAIAQQFEWSPKPMAFLIEGFTVRISPIVELVLPLIDWDRPSC